MASLIKQIK